MNNEHTEEATMRGKKFLKLCMLVCYCIWCCLEVYIMWSGMQLNGNTVSGNIMIYRQNLYYCRTILEWAVVCIFFLNHINLLRKAEQIREKIYEMSGSVLILMGISSLAVICNFFITGSMDGWLNFFEPFYMILPVAALLLIFRIWKESQTDRGNNTRFL